MTATNININLAVSYFPHPHPIITTNMDNPPKSVDQCLALALSFIDGIPTRNLHVKKPPSQYMDQLGRSMSLHILISEEAPQTVKESHNKREYQCQCILFYSEYWDNSSVF